MENDKFKKMTDEQLVTIVNNRLFISGEEGIAAAELHRRQKQRNDKNRKLQKWILGIAILAVIIAATTLFFVII